MSAPQGIRQPAVNKLNLGGTTTQRKGNRVAGNVPHGGKDSGVPDRNKARANGIPSQSSIPYGGKRGDRDSGNVGRGGVDSRAPSTGRARQSGIPTGGGGRPAAYRYGAAAARTERALRGKSF